MVSAAATPPRAPKFLNAFLKFDSVLLDIVVLAECALDVSSSCPVCVLRPLSYCLVVSEREERGWLNNKTTMERGLMNKEVKEERM